MEQSKLIAGCQRNQRKAQNELFRRYKDLVMSISQRYSRDRSGAEDVFQESFIRIFKSLAGKTVEIDDLASWIARITINTNINHFYKSQKDQFEEMTDEHMDDGHKEVIDRLSNEELLVIINEMPDGYRVIFNMFFIDGYKHKEIADQLEISESTSRSQLTRAKEFLKKKLESQGIYRYEDT